MLTDDGRRADLLLAEAALPHCRLPSCDVARSRNFFNSSLVDSAIVAVHRQRRSLPPQLFPQVFLLLPMFPPMGL